MFQPRSLRKKVPNEPKPLLSAAKCLEHFEQLNRPSNAGFVLSNSPMTITAYTYSPTIIVNISGNYNAGNLVIIF